MTTLRDDLWLTVGKLRAALAAIPDDVPVIVEVRCSEGCGVGSDDLHSVREGWANVYVEAAAGSVNKRVVVLSTEDASR